MVACGAGAGLAAVYNVPLGGAVFVLEVLLGSFGLPALVLAIVTSSVAALVAQMGLGNEHQYLVPSLTLNSSLVVWSVVCGPIFGAAAWSFAELMKRSRATAPTNGRLPVLSLLKTSTLDGLWFWRKAWVRPVLSGFGIRCESFKTNIQSSHLQSSYFVLR